MPETIKASEQNLNKVFCNDYVFEIPHYQRPYAWTTDEVGELLVRPDVERIFEYRRAVLREMFGAVDP